MKLLKEHTITAYAKLIQGRDESGHFVAILKADMLFGRSNFSRQTEATKEFNKRKWGLEK